MRITKLKMKNWCCHEDRTMEFRAGLVGMLGANGSGKSSALDALRFAITGTSIGAGNRADNLRYGAKNGHVIVEFDHDGKPYHIKRKVESAGQVLTLPDDRTLTRTAEIDEFVEQLLNTRIDALLNNVFVGQHAIDSILFKTNSERLKEFQETFGLLRLAEAHRLLSTEMSLHKITDGLDVQISVLSTDKMADEKALADKTATLKTLDAELRQLDVFVERLRRYEALQRSLLAIEEADKAVVDVQAQLDAAMKRRDQAQAELGDIEEFYKQVIANKPAIEAEWQRVATAKSMFAKLAKAEADLAAAKTRVPQQVPGDPAPLAEKVADAERKLAEANALPMTSPEITELEAQYHKLIAKRQLLLTRAKDEREVELTQQVTRMRKDATTFATGICPTCKQPVANHDPVAFKKELEAVERELAAYVAQATEAFNEVVKTIDDAAAQLATKLAAVRKQFNEQRSGMVKHATAWLTICRQQADANAAEARAYKQATDAVQSAQAMVDSLLPYRLKDEEIKRAQERHTALKELEDNFQLLSSVLLMRQGECAHLMVALDRTKTMRASLSAAEDVSKEEIAEAEAKMAEVSARTQQRSTLLTEIGILQAKVNHYENQLAQLNSQYQKEQRIRAWNKRCGLVRDAFHINGLPKLLMQEYAVRLNRRMQYYMQIWEAPFRLHLNDELAFIAEFPTGVVMPATRLSGGQKIVASISFRLAMSDTFARNAGLIVLDEPTNHLDEANITHLQQLLLKLKVLAGTTGRQIIVVTHAAGLTGFFDHVIQI